MICKKKGIEFHGDEVGEKNHETKIDKIVDVRSNLFPILRPHCYKEGERVHVLQLNCHSTELESVNEVADAADVVHLVTSAAESAER